VKDVKETLKPKIDKSRLRPQMSEAVRVVERKDRRTRPRRTLYEDAAARGVRAEHLEAGGPTTAPVHETDDGILIQDVTDPKRLSKIERDKGRCPIVFRRPVDFVSGVVVEEWHFSELEPPIPPAFEGIDRDALPL
jgi:hypothetical protein